MKKYRNLRKNPLPRIGKGFFDFHLSSTNKSNSTLKTSSRAMRRIYYRGEEDCKHESDFYLLSAVFCLLSFKK